MKRYSLFCIKIFWLQSLSSDKTFSWVMTMTSSTINSNKVVKNSMRYKSRKLIVIWKFWTLENLSDIKTDSVIFSFYSKTYQKVRKMSIWLKQQKYISRDSDMKDKSEHGHDRSFWKSHVFSGFFNFSILMPLHNQNFGHW